MKKHAYDTDEKTYDTSFLSCISQDMQTQKEIIPLVYILKMTVGYTYLYYTHNFLALFKKNGNFPLINSVILGRLDLHNVLLPVLQSIRKK